MHRAVYRVQQKRIPKGSFCSFLSNRVEFQSENLPTYLVVLYVGLNQMNIILCA